MKKSSIVLIVVAIIIGIILLIGAALFGYYKNLYNKEVALNQQVKSQWANVESSYQRRADLIPNLVNTVKGYADFEKETLTQVIEARSKATAVNIDAANLNAENFGQFQQAQAGLSSALSRLLLVVERYPDLKANQNFLELQAQLEGTENRINVERNRYNQAVEEYNRFALRFWVNILFRLDEKPYFEAEAGSEIAPVVEF